MQRNTIAHANILSTFVNLSDELCCCRLRKFIFDNFAKMQIEFRFSIRGPTILLQHCLTFIKKNYLDDQINLSITGM